MKTTNTENNYKGLKISTLFTIIIALLLFSNNVFSQMAARDNFLLTEKVKMKCPYVNFEYNAIGGKVFLKWTCKSNEQKTLFIIQKSDDGKNFETLKVKEGVCTKADVSLLYCYVDEKPNKKGKTYYRIGKIDKNGDIKYSEELVYNKLKPENQTKSFAQIKN